ncbi:hypothetical protein [Massilia sp. CCM 8734]|uniref:hypothetical protein n=1 Tax=Massilia sp. CCM 8734 TaxID=2609283 RepID=UPI00169E97B7|nr:hypothetical protein [Massilia sp. CCM 8734]NIA00056.1 hypothetical protein [Massilia sp. CCM 8734]
MMNKPILAMCTALVLLAAKAFAQAAPPDPPADKIAALVSALAKNPLWMNGLTPHVKLGAGASPPQVLELFFLMINFDAGPVSKYTIVAVRDVVIPPEGSSSPTMTAMLVETNLGPKIVLIRFERDGWWTRAFDAR